METDIKERKYQPKNISPSLQFYVNISTEYFK